MITKHQSYVVMIKSSKVCIKRKTKVLIVPGQPGPPQSALFLLPTYLVCNVNINTIDIIYNIIYTQYRLEGGKIGYFCVVYSKYINSSSSQYIIFFAFVGRNYSFRSLLESTYFQIAIKNVQLYIWNYRVVGSRPKKTDYCLQKESKRKTSLGKTLGKCP